MERNRLTDAGDPPGADVVAADDLVARVAGLESEIAQLAKEQRLLLKRLARVAAQVESLVRLSVDPALWPRDAQHMLNYRRFGLLSQNGEEGVLAALLSLLGPPLRRFVEIGCGDNGGNSGLFAGELGWEGLMIDRERKAVAACHARFGHNPRLRLVTAAVTPGNVNQLVEDAGLTGDLDYVSIDIDSVDFWVLEALEACRPRVLVLEYNAYFGPDRSVTVAADADFANAPKGYFGASLAALTKLAARKGYRLLACEETGVNAFFLRDELLPGLHAVDARTAFRPIKVPSGHPREGLPRDAERILAGVLRSGLPLTEI